MNKNISVQTRVRQKTSLSRAVVTGIMIIASAVVMGSFAAGIVVSMTGLKNNRVILEPGDIFRGNQQESVYYLGNDNKKYVFPNPLVYKSWYSEDVVIKNVPQEIVNSFVSGGNILIRPGTKLLKSDNGEVVYAVEPNGVLRKISNEETFKGLGYRNDMIITVPGEFLAAYTIGEDVTLDTHPTSALVKFSELDKVYYIDGNYIREVTAAGFQANHFNKESVLVDSIYEHSYMTGSRISTYEPELSTLAGPIIERPLPDLTVNQIKLSPSLRSYAGFPFNGENAQIIVQNQGEVLADDFNVYLNLEVQTPPYNSTGHGITVNQLKAGGTKKIPFTFNSFLNTILEETGVYIFKASANPYHNLKESDYSNNFLESANLVVLPNNQAPVISNIREEFIGNETMRISFLLSETTGASLHYSRGDEFPQPLPDGSQPKWYAHSIEAINDGNNNYHADIQLEAGSAVYHYSISVNGTNVITREDLTFERSLPDLTVSPLTINNNHKFYADYPFTGEAAPVVVKNIGDAPVANFEVQMFVVDVAHNDTHCSATKLMNITLQPGAETPMKFEFNDFLTCPSLAEEPYYLQVAVDRRAQITESNEDNNWQFSEQFTPLSITQAPYIYDLLPTDNSIQFSLGNVDDMSTYYPVVQYATDEYYNENHKYISGALPSLIGDKTFIANLNVDPGVLYHYRIALKETNFTTADWTFPDNNLLIYCNDVIYHSEQNPNQPTKEERIDFCLDLGYYYAGLVKQDEQYHWYGNCREHLSDGGWSNQIDLRSCNPNVTNFGHIILNPDSPSGFQTTPGVVNAMIAGLYNDSGHDQIMQEVRFRWFGSATASNVAADSVSLPGLWSVSDFSINANGETVLTWANNPPVIPPGGSWRMIISYNINGVNVNKTFLTELTKFTTIDAVTSESGEWQGTPFQGNSLYF